MRSIRCQTYQNFETIVVDNQSADSTVDIIKNKYPEVKLIEVGDNPGFAISSNLGVKNAVGETLIFLNPDVFFDENFLAEMVEFKRKHGSGILGPKILDFQGNSHYGGLFLSIDAYGYPGFRKKPFYIEGCALMIDKQDFERIGKFDEKYFMYSEDIDLCWRALLFGMKIEVCENAVLCHYGGGSSKNTSLLRENDHFVPYIRRYEVEKNNLRNLLKNYCLINLLWTLPIFLLISFFEAVFYLLTGNIKAAGLLIQAFLWNILNVKDTWEERFRIQSDRAVGDLNIIRRMSGFIPNKFLGLLIVGIPKFK